MSGMTEDGAAHPVRASGALRRTARGGYNSRTEPENSMTNNPQVSPSSQGWGVAAFIIILAIVANTVAYKIHQATYLKPDAAPSAAAEH